MNILYVSHKIFKSHGGLQRLLKFTEIGYNIYFLGGKINNEPYFESFKGINIFRCNPLFNLPHLNYPISIPLLLIKKLISKYNIDLIHGLGVQSPLSATAGIFSNHFTNIPFILSIQGVSQTTGVSLFDFISKSYDITLGRMIVGLSSKIIVLGRDLMRRAMNLGATKDKIILCPPGVDLERFNPDKNRNMDFRENLGLENSFVIGFVGRFVPLKGIFDLLKASKIVSKQHSIHLLLVGDGPLRRKIERTAHYLGVPFTTTGWVDDPEKYYSAMDVFVLPSYSEGVPRTCLEAMAMKKPLIVTDVGSNKEIVRNGENGFLIHPGDSKSLADNIITLIKNDSLLKEWGFKNRKIVEKKYNLEQEINTLKNIYLNVIKSGHK